MVASLKAWVAVWCLSTTPAVAWTTPTSDRRGLLARSFSGAGGAAAVTLSTWTARPLPSRAATAAEAKAMLAERQGKIDAEARAAAAAAALKVSNFQTTELGLRYEELRAGSGPPPQYTLSIGGFPGEDEWVKIDGSKGFMKPPGGYGCYAGVGDRGIMGAPIVGLDLMLMDMQAGSARRVVIPPSLAFGERGIGGITGSKIPPNSPLYMEIELLELGDEPVMDPAQEEFLRVNPLPVDRRVVPAQAAAVEAPAPVAAAPEAASAPVSSEGADAAPL